MTMDAGTLAKVRELQAVATRAFDVGLQTGSGGNVSIRLARADHVLIKPSGVGYRECDEHNLLIVDLDGRIVGGAGRPSQDMPFHLLIYKVRPDVAGIVHVHSPWATAWAVAGREIPLVTVQARQKMKRLPLVPRGPGDGNQRPEAIAEAFRDPAVSAALLEGHGSVGVGKTLLAAEQIVELIEETAQIAAVSRWLLAAPAVPGR